MEQENNNINNQDMSNGEGVNNNNGDANVPYSFAHPMQTPALSPDQQQQQQQQQIQYAQMLQIQQQQQQYMQYMQQMQQMQMEMQMLQRQQQEMAAAAAAAAQLNLMPPFMQPSHPQQQPEMQMQSSLFQPQPQPQSNMNEANWSSANNTSNGNVLQWLSQKAHVETASTLNKSDSYSDTNNNKNNNIDNASSANIVPGVQSRGAIEYLLKQQQQQQQQQNANQKSSTSLRPATFSLSAMLRAADAVKQMESKERQQEHQLQQTENTEKVNNNNINDETHKEVEITTRLQEGVKNEQRNNELLTSNNKGKEEEQEVITFTSTTSVVIQPDTNTIDLTKDINNKNESEEESTETSSPNVLNLLAELLQRQANEAEVPQLASPPFPSPSTNTITNVENNNNNNNNVVASSTDQMKQVEQLQPPQPQGQRYLSNHPQDLNRGVRGRRRPNNERNYKFHQQRQMQHLQQQKAEEEARKKHEEAMQNDPEYQRQFTSMQERMQAMQMAQMEFFNIYSRQEHVQLNQSITERLDMNMILDLIDKHDVVFICTDTGSGKSTNVPRALLELSNETRVVSTQPRRTATVAIASRVAQLRREAVGEDVGYWIRGEKKGDEQTRLWYMTSYTLLLRILEAQGSLPYTHIVLDEFHERQPDLEVTVALLRLALLHKTSHFKLILMSATLDTEDWVQYFTGLRVATYKQSEPEHPIYNYFMEDTCRLLGLDYTSPTNLVQRVMVDKNTLDKHLYIAQSLIEFLNSCSHPHHAILVFLPGRAQVEHLQSWALAQLGPRVDVIPWHSAVDLSEIENAIRRRTPNRQKLYLATDIAEVSITIPDVVYVIDLVLVKRPKISQSVAASILYPPLVTQWISQGSIAQRRGRIGRVQQGFYFCLFPSDQIASLSPYAQPPIENSRIDELSLHCLQVVSNPVAIFSICHGQPLIETITSSMNTLTELGCIIPSSSSTSTSSAESGNMNNNKLEKDEQVPELAEARSERWSALVLRSAQEYVTKCIAEYECTFIGRILQLIPVSPQPGMLVFFGFLTGLESLMILAAAVTSSLSPFIVGSALSSNVPEAQRRNRRNFNVARAMEDTENTMRDLCCGLRSDIVAVMKATLLFEIEAAHSGANVQNVQQWCMQKNLSYEKLLAIVDLEQHIKFELANFVPFRDINDPTLLLSQLDKLAAMVAVMTNVAFVAQALEVTSESNLYSKTQEMALGLFSDLTAVPDIHSPSCLRWQEGDIIIPTQLNLFYDKLLASFSTAIASPKQFWMSLLLFTQHLHFATFSDEDGNFHVFELTYCGKKRFVELDDIAGIAVLEFRRRLSLICATLRLLHEHKLLDEETLLELLQQHGLKPLHEAQREVITMLVSIFTNLDGMTVDEVEHEEDDLDIVSALSFALPPLVDKAQE